MHGNVWEWCLDHGHENYEGAPMDDSPWLSMKLEESGLRVLRGGSWGSGPEACRSASRSRTIPIGNVKFVGFRVVCLPKGPSLNS
jgi:formylglycine-generating enzyme required for sulfatase activity